MRSLRWFPRVLLAAAVALLLAAACPAQAFSPALYAGLRWRMIGPFRGGRTVAVTGVPGRPNVFYIAPVDGGVWKSTDYGRTWKPLFDHEPTGSIGALAVAPSDARIIYAGSGEGLQRPDLSVGNGIYKSTDGGRHWQHLGLRDGEQINSIVVDPHNPNRVFVAVLGHPYGPNAERGVFRSLDGGHTWKKVLYRGENTGAIQVALDPANPQTVYASMWAARRPPWTTGGSIEGHLGGLYKSTDGGGHWVRLRRGLPTRAQGLGRIGIGIAPGDPSRIYALVDAPKVGGLFRSDDAGQSWRRVNHQHRIWGRGDDFAGVTVDPRNPDEVYVANTSTYRSMDGGFHFTAIKGAPGGDDYHTVWVNPRNPDIILLGSDQGATISVNHGRTWSSWYNQPTAEFYHVTTDNRFPYRVYGGQQESGTIATRSRSDYGSITFRDWHPVGGEEYGYIAPDPLHPWIVYAGKVTRFNERTGEVQDVSPAGMNRGKYRFNRTMPLVFSPVDPHELYFAAQVLFKTLDGGRHWQVISPDLTRPQPGVPPSLGIFATEADQKKRGVIYTIAPSPLDGDLIWVGTDDGNIQVTRDGGKTWTNVTPPAISAWSKLAMIDAGHFAPGTAYAAVNRMRLNDQHPYVYRTHDFGKTWTLITRGLPANGPVNTVREDPQRKGLLFAGTETSVYVSFDDGGQWEPLRQNLPATSMRDLVIHGNDLVLGTHGRSFWILDDITPLRQITAQVAASPAWLFRPQKTWRMRRDENTDTPLPPEVPAGQNPPAGAILDYWLKAPARGAVTLAIYDSQGQLIRRFSSADRPKPVNPDDLNVPMYWVKPPQVLSGAAGMHRFVWNLRFPDPPSLRAEYPISAIPHDTPPVPEGPLVLAGTYTVKLTAGGRTFSQPLVIRMDPRVHVAPAALESLFRLQQAAAAGARQSSAALQQLRGLAEGMEKQPLAVRVKAGLERLNGRFGELLVLTDTDAAPTTVQEQELRRLQAQLRAALGQMNILRQQ